MKHIKRFVTLLLALLLLCSAVGCGKTPDEPSGPDSYKKPSYSNTVETSDLFYNVGRSDYVLVQSENPTTWEARAISEINFFLKEALRIELPVVSEGSFSYSASGKYISIGKTKLLQESGIVVANDYLKTSGYAIYSKDNVTYLYGSTNRDNSYGVLYAAYGLLEELIDLKLYTSDCYTYETKSVIKMRKFDEMTVPDIDMRDHSSTRMDTTYKMRLRYYGGEVRRLGNTHTHFIILPPEKYYAEHPDWYNSDCTQLRLLNEEMTEEFIKQVKQHLIDEPTATNVFIGLEDVNTPFSEEDQKTTEERYHTNETGLNIIFLNKVITAVEEWLQEEYPDRYVTYTTAAYYSHTTPPVDYNKETGKYTPHSDLVIPHEKLSVMLTYIGLPSWTYPLNSEEQVINQSFYQNFKGWASICDNLSIYAYGINYRNFLMNFNDWSSLQSNLKFCYENGVHEWYQLACTRGSSPAFEELRIYVLSQLLWDTSLSYQELAIDFINAYYGDAAPEIMEYFNLTITTNIKNITEQNASQACTTGYPGNANFWPYELVVQMSNTLERAESKIAYLDETDHEQYKVMLNRVRQQKVTVQYLLLNHYRTYIPNAEMAAMLDEMEKTCRENNFTNIDEAGDGDVLQSIANWRKEIE